MDTKDLGKSTHGRHHSVRVNQLCEIVSMSPEPNVDQLTM